MKEANDGRTAWQWRERYFIVFEENRGKLDFYRLT